MRQHSFGISSHEAMGHVVTSIVKPMLPATVGWLAHLEDLIVRWQAKRLQELSPEVLWAKSLQDRRSFAEIRRSRA
ncbi:MAG: hypothetical protein JSS01_08725 [Proteobacteria bacterium]|nr:hypothetical protein [Pseudomonadota bacterium]